MYCAEIEYAVGNPLESGEEEYLILAKALVEKNFGEDADVVRTMTGAELVGVKYIPLFAYDTPVDVLKQTPSEKHWQVIAGDFVDLETGTGIVHIAPAFGEDDYRICREQGIGFLCFVKPDGTFDER